jgi:short-subunit dehydrogenase
MSLETWRGDWALVTGASAGIGREFARQLAEAGLNLALTARRADRLEELAAGLRAQHGVRTLVVPLDLARPGAPEELRARLQVEGITVRLLINNAAVGHWGTFANVPAEDYAAMVGLNVTTVVTLCRLFLPDLAAHARSVVLNVSSPAALQPMPYMAVYAASKAFVSSFSQALYAEWAERGVLVKALLPGPTRTEFETRHDDRIAALGQHRDDPADVVRAALAALERDTPLVATARGTYRQRVLAALLPARLLARAVAKRFRPPSERDVARQANLSEPTPASRA